MAKNDVEAGRAHVLLSIRDKLQQGLRVAEKRLRQFGTVMATSGGVIAAGMGAALAWPIKLAANMEQTKTSFAVFLGSVSLAEQKLKELEALDESAPFTFDQLKDAAQTLLNFGVSADALIPTLRNLGDVSGGDAERFSRLALAFGQVMAKGRLMGQEVNQMVEAGFNPLQEISRITGRSMKDLSDAMENGQISSRMLATAFATASGPGGRFYQMMEKQAKTLTGLFSALMTNVTRAVRAIGDALTPVLKELLQISINVTKRIAEFVRNNVDLVWSIGVAAVVLTAIGGIFVGLGAAIMTASFVVGLIASAFSVLTGIVFTLLSPVGVFLGLLAVIAVNAYVFRAALASALQPFITFIQPAIDAILVLYNIFAETWGGIIGALKAGELETAMMLAWKGVVALTWTALDFLLGSVFEATGSIGRAILAGQWDIMAAIAMTKVRLVVLQAWNGIKFFWDMAATGMGSVWDGIVWGMKTAFRTMVFGIAQSITWIGQRFYDLLGFLEPIFEYIGQKDLFNNVREAFNTQGMGNILSDMQAQAQAEDDKAMQSSMMRRDKANLANMESRAASEKALMDELALYQTTADEAASKAGVSTLGDKAQQAQDALNAALANAEQERASRLKNAEDKSKGPQSILAGAVGTGGGKSGATGTFSALGSMLAGTTRNRAADQTAANTKRLVKLAEDEAKKKQTADAMKE